MNHLRETISATTVSSTILTSLANARRSGEPWTTLAEEYLASTETLLIKTDVMSRDLLHRYALSAQAQDKMKDAVLLLLESLADALWAARKHESNDTLLSVISPDTPGFFLDWDIGQPADRLDVFIALLSGDTVPAIEGDPSLRELKKILPEYHARCEASRTLRAQLAVVEKASESIARAGHVQYSRLRKRMRAEGFDPFEVRKVLPDIPGQSMSGTLS